MQKLTAYVSGKVQESGYRSKVVTMAKTLGVRGFVKNLSDGRVMVVAEGERSDLERLYKALWIKNAIIDVSLVEEHYGEATGIFDDFDKIVGDNETDSRLDTAANYLKVLITLTEKGLDKQDQMLEKQDQMLEKQDQMLEKQDQMLEKQDQMLEKQDQMLEKQDRMLDKQDIMISNQEELMEKVVESKEEIVGEIKELRSDLKGSLDERLTRIENDVAQIKAKVGL